MYKSKLAVAIKHNGKILRETKDIVKLPFGSEFSVLVKNLNSRRVKFTLHIDGTDVLDGEQIIVNANSEIEMKRFIRNGNMNEGNAFKFIERTVAIEDGPRGIKVDDGVVRVEFWFEQEAPEIKTTYHRDVWWDEYYRTRRYPPYTWPEVWNGVGPVYSTSGTLQNGTFSGSSISATSGNIQDVKLGSVNTGITKGMSASVGQNAARSANAVFSSNTTLSSQVVDSQSIETKSDAELNDAGITVPGSKVEQKFHTVYGFKPEAQSHVIILRLVGAVGSVEVVEPVTVKTKQKCITCGHTNKHNAKFCSQCGTGLEIL